MASPVEEIKARLDVAEYIGRDVRLSRAGRYLKGLCPFHSERTPSFFVFGDRGTFKCFGCNEGGDLFSYVMRRDGVEFPDALRTLAPEAGVELSGERVDPESAKRRTSVRSALTEAARFMHELLLEAPQAKQARAYLAKRELAAAAIKTFQLGYAPASGSPVVTRLRELGIAPEVIRESGLARADEADPRDYFFDRLVFPIWDRRGQVVGFGARALGDAQPKYLNTRDSDVFTKGHQLYGYHLARDAIRQAGSGVIVEGYMDAIAAHENGFTNTVASMGTALTAEQAGLLVSSGAKRIILALDADTAGAAATRRGIDVLRESADYEDDVALDLRGLVRHEGRLATDIGIVELPEAEDPDSLIRADRARWRALIERPTPLADYYFRWAMREHDLSTLSGRQQAVRDLVPVVVELSDAVVRSHYFNRLAEISGVPADELRQLARRRKPRRGRVAGPATPENGDAVEEGFLELVLQAPAEQAGLLAQLDAEYLADPALRHILSVMVRMLRARADLDWDAVAEELDEGSRIRFSAVRERAAAKPTLADAAYTTALQSATLRLRERRIEAELRDANAVSAAAGDEAESRDADLLVARLAAQKLSVQRARTELSVLASGRAG